MTAKERLQDFIRERSPGGCKLVGNGEHCECLLCLLDAVEDQAKLDTANRCVKIARQSGGFIAEHKIKKEFKLP